MPKTAKKLSAKAVSELKWNPKHVDTKGRPYPTMHPVGPTNLYLQVTQTGSKVWMFRYSYLGKRRKFSPGGYIYQSAKGSAALTLKQAAETAAHLNGLLDAGIDPRAERRRLEIEARAEENKYVTFKEFTETHFIPKKQTEYKGADQIRRLQQLLRDYVYPHIGTLRINDIDKKHIVAILEQKSGTSTFWRDKHDAAKRTQNYVENIFNQAIALDYRTASNPAIWRGLLSEVLPSPKKVHKVTHRPAIHHKQLPQFVKILIELDDPKGSRPDIHCFLFGVLTVARSNEARLVDWDEIDLRKKVWRMPAGKYKSEKDWVIPLTRETIKILKAQPSAKYQEGRVFSTLDGGKIGDKKLSSMPKALGFDAVFNGFRRTFRTWCQKKMFNNEASELAMKHLDTSRLKQVYIDDPGGKAMLKERRIILEKYERKAFKLIHSPSPTAKVVELRKSANQ